MPRSSAIPQTETPAAAHIALCLLVMSAGWSVLLIAWPYLVELLPPRHQFTAERSWYALRVAVPALAGLAGLPFIERHRRRLPALAVSIACFSLAVIAAAIEVQRVDGQRGDMPMMQALKQSDKFVWYGAALAAFTSLGAGLTVHKRPQGARRS